MEFKEVLKTDDLGEGQIKRVEVSGQPIDIVLVGGRYLAFSDTCTHEQCSLAEGFLEGATVECPCHGSKFNVESGAVVNLPAVTPIKTYPVKVGGDTIAIGI